MLPARRAVELLSNGHDAGSGLFLQTASEPPLRNRPSLPYDHEVGALWAPAYRSHSISSWYVSLIVHHSLQGTSTARSTLTEETGPAASCKPATDEHRGTQNPRAAAATPVPSSQLPWRAGPAWPYLRRNYLTIGWRSTQAGKHYPPPAPESCDAVQAHSSYMLPGPLGWLSASAFNAHVSHWT